MTITTAQIRGARGILNWSQQDLAQRTGISATSIGAIENNQTTPRESTLSTIRKTFETGGIEFIGLDGMRLKTSYIHSYNGSEGFKEFMDDVYDVAKKEGGEIVLFNAHPPHWYKWLGEEWFQQHSKRMSELGDHINFKITARKGETQLISKGFAEYKWFPEDLFSDRALYAYGDKIAFVNFDKNDVSVITLAQPEFAKAFRVLFNIAWENVAIAPQELNKRVS